ncbi:MAG: hypothetical protein R2827_10165 [Bdellovibrionales bacterium]
MNEKIQNELKGPKEWVEIFPYGLTLALNSREPLFLFKDHSEKYVLPIHLDQHEAELALHCFRKNNSTETSMELPKSLLKRVGMNFKRAIINEVAGHHQYMVLEIEFNGVKFEERVRADHGLSICLRMDCPFYTTVGHVRKMREVQSDVERNAWAKPVVDSINNPNYLN